MWGCEDVKMRRCEDEKMWKCEDVRMWKCEDEKMRRCEDVMWRWEDVKMWGWEDVRMWGCENVKMWCEDVNMFDRPPLLEEPFAQTLSGRKKTRPPVWFESNFESSWVILSHLDIVFTLGPMMFHATYNQRTQRSRWRTASTAPVQPGHKAPCKPLVPGAKVGQLIETMVEVGNFCIFWDHLWGV